MTYEATRISKTCMDVLARAYYGINIIGKSPGKMMYARRDSLRACINKGWIVGGILTEEGLRNLRLGLLRLEKCK